MSLHRRLVSQSTIIFGGRLFGAGIVFLVQAMIARLWGAGHLGDFLIITATCNLIAVAMPLGFHTIAAYFAAEYRARNERKQLGVFMLHAYGHILGTLALLAACGPFVLALLGQGDSAAAHYYGPVVLLAFSGATVMLSGSLLIGLKRPFSGFFADGIFRPLILAAALFGAMGMADHDQAFTQMLWGSALGFALIALVQTGFAIMAWSAVPGRDTEVRPRENRRWWRFAMPWVLIALATDFFFDINLLLLSQILDREELAIFGVCTRIFALVSFGVAAVYAVSMPDMFESEANADRSAFHRKVGDANMVATALSIVLFCITALGAPIALQFFGPGFTAGAGPLAVLCLALVVRSALGPASLVLSIHDRPYASLPAVALGIGVLFVGNWLLAPSFGLMGAAISALIAITVWSIALWAIALRTAKMDVSILQWFRSRRLAVTPAE
jgi:O-antigen/teichoic acid export membrane protein